MQHRNGLEHSILTGHWRKDDHDPDSPLAVTMGTGLQVSHRFISADLQLSRSFPIYVQPHNFFFLFFFSRHARGSTVTLIAEENLQPFWFQDTLRKSQIAHLRHRWKLLRCNDWCNLPLAHAKPRLQPEFQFSTSNPGLACDWKWLPACLLPNSELVERVHGVWSSWAVLVPYSMMNRRLISLVYESTAPPNDAHTRCFYLKSYLGYILFDWWQIASMQTPKMSEFILSCSWIFCHFHRIQSACDQSAEGRQVRSYNEFDAKSKRLQGILVMLKWEC